MLPNLTLTTDSQNLDLAKRAHEGQDSTFGCLRIKAKIIYSLGSMVSGLFRFICPSYFDIENITHKFRAWLKRYSRLKDSNFLKIRMNVEEKEYNLGSMVSGLFYFFRSSYFDIETYP